MDDLWEYNMPIVSGYYFWQRSQEETPEIVKLTYTEDGWTLRDFNGAIHEITNLHFSQSIGRWCGPLLCAYPLQDWKQT